jgi:hypothetical protein
MGMAKPHTENAALKGPKDVAQGHNNVDLITLPRQIGITYQAQKRQKRTNCTYIWISSRSIPHPPIRAQIRVNR